MVEGCYLFDEPLFLEAKKTKEQEERGHAIESAKSVTCANMMRY